MPKIADRAGFLAALAAEYPNKSAINRAEITAVCNKIGLKYPPSWFVLDTNRRVGRGLYSIADTGSVDPVVKKTVKVAPVEIPQTDMVADNASIAAMAMVATDFSESLVPEKAKGYVPFGHFNDVRSIIKSKRFYPTYVTGLSGNGKTMMIEQVCASEGRELVRANITKETDEDDLIGGFRLIDGKTVWQNGPVIVAMERGAVLLLDEVDLGDAKLMCLQPVLEGKSVYLKKINRVVTPAKGFTILATANTKGKGSDDGRFIGTNVMNEAFLERFSITLEQEYPSTKVEQKILTNVLAAADIQDNDFVEKLVQWAEVIRKSFYEGAVSEIISTRRLVHICEAYGIFNQNREKAINLCLNRFDVDTKNSFLDLYKKLDEKVEPVDPASTVSSDEEIAF